MLRVVTQTVLVLALGLILLFLETLVAASTNHLSAPSNARCACSGDVLTFECTRAGGTRTIWNGTAFDCSNSNNEIILSNTDDGVMKSCSDGAIVGRITAIDGNCYISQLNVTVNASFNNKTVQCVRSSDRQELIGESSITVLSATNPYPPPNDVNLAAVGEGRVTLNWTSGCSSVDYIVTSNCSGVCPTSTNTASAVICTGFKLPTDSNDTMCSLGISSRACDLTSDLSTTAIIRVPDAPTVVGIVPTYSNESRMLTRVEFTPVIQTEVISNDISGPILSYIPAFLSSSGLFHSTRVSAKSGGGPFNYTVDVPSELCSASTFITVNISAANRVGRGFPSDTATIECVNNFVRVNFDSDSTITCTFVGETGATEKSCRIDYGLYDNGPTVYNSTERSTNNTISLNLMNLVNGRYQYVVLASSGMNTVRVEGTFTKDPPKRNMTVGIIVGVVVAVLALVVCTGVLAITLLVIRVRRSPRHKERGGKRRKQQQQSSMLPVPEDYFITKQVDTKGTSLKDFCEQHELRKKRLNIFFEVSKMVEKPTEVRDVLLMDKNTENLFSDPVALRKVKENKEQKIDSKWRVLVLGKYEDYSKVDLEPEMWVAYEDPKLAYGFKFCALPVQEDGVRMSDFVTKEIGTFESGKVYYEFKPGDEEDLVYCRKAIRIQDRKVQQLLVKDHPSVLPDLSWGLEASIDTFYAFLPDAPGVGVKSPASKYWRFFIHGTSQRARCLKKGTVVLYNCTVHVPKEGPDLEDNDGYHGKVEVLQTYSQ